MRTNPSWKDLFVFTKRDKKIVVPVVFLFVVFSAFLLFYNPEPEAPDIQNLDAELAKLALPAIGDALSARIVKYRDKIGGFTSVNQVKQTYGLSDSAFGVILPYLRLTSAMFGSK